jgi:hypothetical protein
VVGPILVGVLVVGGLATARSGPAGLRFTDETPDDLRGLASAAWERFTAAVPACAARLGTVTVGVAWELPERARYEPVPAFVLIRAPGTAANLEATLLHEFTHHAERRCPPSAAMRRRLTDAAGLPPFTPWRDGPSWAETPSERFAEAMVVLTLGRPPPHVLIHVRPGELDAVAAWAGG